MITAADTKTPRDGARTRRRRRAARARAHANAARRPSRRARSLAECGNGADAILAIEKHSPDLVFLDIQMPELDGFGVIEAVGAERMPLVIFVTAYDEYAVQAFEVHALDYLLKPVERERFAAALGRAKARLLDPGAARADAGARRAAVSGAARAPWTAAATRRAARDQGRRPAAHRCAPRTSTGSRRWTTTRSIHVGAGDAFRARHAHAARAAAPLGRDSCASTARRS